MCCAMLRCTVLYCTVIPCVCVMLFSVESCLRFVIVIRILKCMAANYVNKPKNAFYMIICNSPCNSRLDGAVNVIALFTKLFHTDNS